jgi:hypothetical protein
MDTLTQSIFVNCPLEEAFNYTTNSEFFDRWMPSVLGCKLVSDAPLRHGSTLLLDVILGKKVINTHAQVSAYEPNQKWAYVVKGKDFWLRRTLSFESLSKGTKIHYMEEFVQTGVLGTLLSSLSKPFSSGPRPDLLKGLKRDLESTGRYLPELV